MICRAMEKLRTLAVAAGVAGGAAGVVGAAACGPATASDEAGAPDVIYHNGKVVTVDEDFRVAEAVAVRNGRIVAVGGEAEVTALAGDATRRVDLEGKTVLPGFADCHVHLGFGGGGEIDLRHVKDVPELQEELRRIDEEVPEGNRGEWLVGRLSETSFPEERLFTRHEIDAAISDRPVALPRGPHIWVVNTRALEMAGIDASTQNPPGGTIARDASGAPTGVLRENPAQRIVGALIPPPEPPSDSTAHATLRHDLRELVSLGITSANIAGIRPGDPWRWVQDAYDRWGSELPRLAVQLRVYPGYDRYDDLEEGVRRTIEEIDGFSVRTGFGDEQLKVSGIKMSVDGGFTGQSAHTLEPYPDGSHGTVRIPEDALYRVGKTAHEMGWQLGIHAIGDGGVEIAVNAVDRILAESPREHRHFLHHLSVVPPEGTLATMAERDIAVCSQPNFTYDLARYYDTAMDGERLETNNPQKTLLERDIFVGYGSDHRPYGPIAAIWAAVTRMGRDGEVYGPEEAVSVEQAIELHTRAAQWLTFDENDRGSLEPGKVADMVVLSGDILSVDPMEIQDIGIERTIIGGEVVYEAEGDPMVAVFDDGVTWRAGDGPPFEGEPTEMEQGTEPEGGS